tara:strand:- start:855 stop:1400 length:546 start_codon:yes stop_codon:yes gene_type:complete
VEKKLITNYFQTPLGAFEIVHDDYYVYESKLTKPELYGSSSHHLIENSSPIYLIQSKSTHTSPLVDQILAELQEYFSNPHFRFQVKLSPIGTTYQKKIWHCLLVIPAGRTKTYGELAKLLNSSPRAVGQACKKNPLTIFIPCHRVVGQSSLGGYMGNSNALSFKKALLDHERIQFAQKQSK